MINDTIIIQCGCHASFVGYLLLTVSNKEIQSHQYELITVDQKIEHHKVEKMAEKIMQPYKALQEEIVGETATILHRYNTLNSTMDDLLLQSVAKAADVQIGFFNGWLYGAPIAIGKITKWDLFNIIPMNR